MSSSNGKSTVFYVVGALNLLNSEKTIPNHIFWLKVGKPKGKTFPIDSVEFLLEVVIDFPSFDRTIYFSPEFNVVLNSEILPIVK